LAVKPVPFVHYIVDFSLKEIITAKGEKVTICEMGANASLNEDYEPGPLYSWGRVLEERRPLEVVCGCFVFLLLKDCWGDMGVIATSHTIPEDPTFQSLVYEGDELAVAKSSNTTAHSEANFDFVWFNAGQRLRIETIPDFETFDNLRAALRKKQKEKEAPQV